MSTARWASIHARSTINTSGNMAGKRTRHTKDEQGNDATNDDPPFWVGETSQFMSNRCNMKGRPTENAGRPSPAFL